MNSLNKLSVLIGTREVGVLAMLPGEDVCTFSYSNEWLHDGFSISPLELPLKGDLFVANRTPFAGNFGIFEDSLPDGYGRYLLHRLLRKDGVDFNSLTPLERLAIVGDSGMGALRYHPVCSPEVSAKLWPGFDEMQQLALDVLGEKSDKDEDLLYYNSGNSGGCRPKCVFHDEDGHWLVKFRHTYDPVDIGMMEYKYMSAARECGIDVVDFKLIEGKYFASRRFDVDASGRRLHTATAGALIGDSILNPKADYKNLLHLTGYLTQDARQVEEMVRRMAFNVFAKNRDDHSKNFTYIYKERNWRLSPAYDLTYSPHGYHGQHATSVNMNGNPTVDDMVAVAGSVRVTRRRAMEIIEEVREVVEKNLRH